MSNELERSIKESGFESVGAFDAPALKVLPEVRDMCAANKCHTYNKNWACPPACGSLEHYENLFKGYTRGYVFQTIVHMEDPFDYAAIASASEEHKKRFHKLVEKTEASKSSILLLGAGTCTLCAACAYPDAPCRFPNKVYPSMEAAGLLVSDVCNLAEVPYYHGKGTVAFVSCALE
ncbi:MAG: DUF2284 domain-containing protein [Coriobacteriales bacterium]|jgi:predicted metal-binding protein|nr:DUF2284 domain-containing protein [Coriobacteriales bacterium]